MNGVGKVQIVRHVVKEMAERGGPLLAELRKAVEGEPRSGHVVDALMLAAGRFEQALLTQDMPVALDAMVDVLFLARDLAVREGRIVVKPAAQA